jgi:hypothetical protein
MSKECLERAGFTIKEQIDAFGEDMGLKKPDDPLQLDAFGKKMDAITFDQVRKALMQNRDKVNSRVLQTTANIRTNHHMNNYDAKDYKGGEAQQKTHALTAMITQPYVVKSGREGVIGADRAADVMVADFNSHMVEFMDLMVTSKFELFKGIFTGIRSTDIQQLNPVQKKMVDDVILELHGTKTGNPEAKKFAKAYKEANDKLHNREINASGKGAKRQDWGLPQKHDPKRIAKVEKSKWLEDILPKLNLKKMMRDNPDLMDETQLEFVIGKIYDSITTNGNSKLSSDPRSRTTVRAGASIGENKAADSRFLQFKDGESYIAYQDSYGSNNLYNTMLQGAQTRAREIALMERFGPVPDEGYNFARNKALKAGANETDFGIRAADSYYKQVRGHSDLDPSFMVNTIASLRNWEVSTKLGGATISTFSDHSFAAITRSKLGMGANPHFTGYVSQFNKGNRKLAASIGLHGDYAVSRLVSEFERQNQQGLTSSRSAAEAIMRVTGLEAHTIAARQVFGMDFNNHVHDLLQSDSINKKTEAAFKKYGINDKDLKKLWAAETIEHGGMKYIDPKKLSIDLQQKFQGMILEETDYAVPTPGTKEQAAVSLGTDPNTVAGATARAGTQFMSFPTTVAMKHGGAILSQASNQDKLNYAAAIVASTTMLGALVIMAKDSLKGQEITQEYIESPEFVFRSLLQGGALPILGDLIFNETGYSDTLSTPITGGLLNDVVATLVFGNINQMIRGEWDDMNIPDDVVTVLKNNTPGTNVWQTRLIMERLVWDKMREQTDPDWKSNMRARERRMRKEEKRESWWKPGELTPGR